ncbi:MAG TPA: hypothetical protein VK177_04280 [Flavobacteriales bacterium]|nr:hypothetical protein [Flavobacteriales bacterium]
MNKNIITEIIWFVAFAVLAAGVYFGLGVQASFDNLIRSFDSDPLVQFASYVPAKLIVICFVLVAFVGYLVRIIVQKGLNNATLITGTAVLLVALIAFNDMKTYLNLVGVDFKHFKLSLLGSGGNLFPAAAKLMTWLKVGMGAFAINLLVNAYFIYRNYNEKKPVPVDENMNADAPIDQVNV